ncbi:MAG: MBL fold metallo-hydrolase [Anaerolineales bacterium]|jgi:glyoxylase-like metal-dependent hydrolase (beta-lactamase superfamily II)
MESHIVSATKTIHIFQSSAGAQIFQIPVEVFPGFWGFVYLVLVEEAVDGQEAGQYRVLIDTGSGFGDCNQHLENGLQAVSEHTGRRIHLSDLTHVFITHGHIDHFGGLSYVRTRTPARIGVHELDLRNLTNYEERLTLVSRRLDAFLIEAGVSPQRRQTLIDMYMLTKSIFRSVKVDFTYEAVGMRVGPFQMLHVPGHSAGHVVIRLNDVLFSGDHVLDRTSPHQSPEHLTLSTGLRHYLHSLELLRPWAAGVRLTLGGHNDPIRDLPTRLDEIRALHQGRLAQVLELLETPHTISDVSHTLFGEVHGYNVLLALEEAGAHVEYLYQLGKLGINNLAELENNPHPTPIRYFRL